MLVTLSSEEKQLLIRSAIRAREKSYSPYSNYRVGAALMTKEGNIFTGCNIENAAYTPTVCAERTAVFKAVSEGYHSFRGIAIAGGPKDCGLQYAFPCGVCRQVLREFTEPSEFVVLVVRNEHEYIEKTLEQLLPDSFGPANLEQIG